MSDPFVADSSIGVAWSTPSQGTPETDQLLDDVALGRSVVVPGLWFIEVANTLLKLERNYPIPAGHRRKALAGLAALSPQVDDAPAVSTFNTVSDVAEKYGLSVYDAAFLELALRRECHWHRDISRCLKPPGRLVSRSYREESLRNPG